MAGRKATRHDPAERLMGRWRRAHLDRSAIPVDGNLGARISPVYAPKTQLCTIRLARALRAWDQIVTGIFLT